MLSQVKVTVLLVSTSEKVFQYFSNQNLLPTFLVNWIWLKNPAEIMTHFDFINKKYPEIILFELNDNDPYVFNQLQKFKDNSVNGAATIGVFSQLIEKNRVEKAFENWANIYLHLKPDADLHRSNLIDICLLDWQYRLGEFDRSNFLLLI